MTGLFPAPHYTQRGPVYQCCGRQQAQERRKSQGCNQSADPGEQARLELFVQTGLHRPLQWTGLAASKTKRRMVKFFVLAQEFQQFLVLKPSGFEMNLF